VQRPFHNPILADKSWSIPAKTGGLENSLVCSHRLDRGDPPPTPLRSVRPG
jgi:hypothetical protein